MCEVTYRFFARLNCMPKSIQAKSVTQPSHHDTHCAEMDTIPLELYLNISSWERSNLFLKCLQLNDIVSGKVTSVIGTKVTITLTAVLKGQKRWINDLGILGSAEQPSDFEQDIDQGEEVLGKVVYKDEHSNVLHLMLQNPNVLQNSFSQLTNTNFDGGGEYTHRCFTEDVESTSLFNNPQSIKIISSHLSINDFAPLPLMNSTFHMKESISELRENQSYKWSMSMVGNGVKHFKEKKFKEASKCFDQAISFYPSNVESFVARGALRANQNDLKSAVDDFRQALKLNPHHKNGKKYLIETTLSIARAHEKERDWKSASHCYQEVLKIDPSHTNARERHQQITHILSNKIMMGKMRGKMRGKMGAKNKTESVGKSRRKTSSSSSTSSSEASSDDDDEWVERKAKQTDQDSDRVKRVSRQENRDKSPNDKSKHGDKSFREKRKYKEKPDAITRKGKSCINNSRNKDQEEKNEKEQSLYSKKHGRRSVSNEHKHPSRILSTDDEEYKEKHAADHRKHRDNPGTDASIYRAKPDTHKSKSLENPVPETFEKKLRGFSSEELQLVSKLLKGDERKRKQSETKEDTKNIRKKQKSHGQNTSHNL